MRIEKISDNQIRCTLTQDDLADRHLKLSELAYGTEKAKSLFREMMQQANSEFGFEADDIPLMIEAIPVSQESIILVITKVEYPDELDTRFSKFSDMGTYADSSDDSDDVIVESADDILGLFKRISDEKAQQHDDITTPDDFVPLKDTLKNTDSSEPAEEKEEPSAISVPVDLTKLFVFQSLEHVSKLAHILKDFYEGENTLYKCSNEHRYYLVLHKSNLSPEVFNKVCNILSEYAHQETYNSSIEAYFKEHYQVLCADCALQSLAKLSGSR